MQSLAIKRSTRRCNLKRYAKGVVFKADFAVLGAKKRSSRPLIGYIIHQAMMESVCLSSRLVHMHIARAMAPLKAPKLLLCRLLGDTCNFFKIRLFQNPFFRPWDWFG